MIKKCNDLQKKQKKKREKIRMNYLACKVDNILKSKMNVKHLTLRILTSKTVLTYKQNIHSKFTKKKTKKLKHKEP